MKNGQCKMINYYGKDVQLFKYVIKNEEYYILTSIIEKISIAEIKALYWRRWCIETNNKKFKYDLLYGNVRTKTYNSLMVDIECIRFITILAAIIEYIGKENKSRKKINSKNSIEKLYSHLLIKIIYNKNNNESNNELCRIVGIICKTITIIIKNRSYDRIRINPKSKWDANGTRSDKKEK